MQRGTAQPALGGPPVLRYGRQQVRRRWLVMGTLGLFLACLTGASWFAGQVTRDRVQDYLYLRQAAQRVEPWDLVVYEPDLIRGDRLVELDLHLPLLVPGLEAYAPPLIRKESREVLALDEALGEDVYSLDRRGALVFLHELTAASGVRRIVAIRFLPWVVPDGAPWVPDVPAGLVAHIFNPGDVARGTRLVGTSRAPLLLEQPVSIDPTISGGSLGFDPYATVAKADLRWYAGQPNPQDRSHFTLAFEVGGRPGVVDGFLSADGSSVHMTVRPQG